MRESVKYGLAASVLYMLVTLTILYGALAVVDHVYSRGIRTVAKEAWRGASN